MGRAFEVRKASMMKTQGAKAKVYSRFGKEIYIAAKAGTPDPEMNVTLKRVIEKAKKSQVPADVIKRAIDKAKGGGGESYNEVRYEGFGPGGCTVIVDCLTDNVNRSVSEVRNCFTKTDSKMGVSGCVSHMYEHQAIVSFEGMDEETALETLLMADCEIEDVENEDGMLTVYAHANELHKIMSAIEESIPNVDFDMAEATWTPNDYVTLEGDELARFEKLMDMLNEVDDVQNIYHNVNN